MTTRALLLTRGDDVSWDFIIEVNSSTLPHDELTLPVRWNVWKGVLMSATLRFPPNLYP
jgi:hypothetical protein